MSSKNIKQNSSAKKTKNSPAGAQPKMGNKKMKKQRQASVAAAYATGQSTGAPMISASRDQCRIVHRELVNSLTGSTAFTVATTLQMNPGLSATFPWLSVQAQGWEQYRFNRLKVCYYTRTASTTPGSVMIVPDYDAADAAPSTEQVASSYEDVQEDAPWKDIDCTLRPSSMHALGPRKFTRSAALAANLDIKTYDVGNVFLCTVDGTAVNWGKVWVEYDVTFFTPQLPPTGAIQAPLSQHFPSSNVPSSTQMLGPTPISTGSAIVSVANNIVTFLELGEYMLTYTAYGSTSATMPGTRPVAGAGISYLTSFGVEAGGAALNAGYTNSIDSGGYNVTQILYVSVNALGAGATITMPHTIVTGVNAELVVVEMGNSQA